MEIDSAIEGTSFVEKNPIDQNNDKKKKYNALTKRDYIIHETIGGGYCGIVKLATSKIHDCKVAIKIVSKFNAPGEYLTKFFPREIETVRGLVHPNLIKYYEAIETTHRIYIIMEYAIRGSLYDYIITHIYVNEIQSQKWFKQLIDVIEYCHNREIAHRDIKCENLLLDNHFILKLADFGFARKVFKVNNNVGLVNTFCGSYAYTAPEILKGRSYNPLISDIWSLGVVLYTMVHGCVPFDDTNYFILLKQIRRGVIFPEKPIASQKCRDLIILILKPIKERPNLNDIKNNSWLTFIETEAEQSNKDATINDCENISGKNDSLELPSQDSTNLTDKLYLDDEPSSVHVVNELKFTMSSTEVAESIANLKII